MNTFAERIGENLKTLRTGADMTQEQLAMQVGVDTSTISTWERGTRLLPIMIFDKLGLAFNLSPQKIFERLYPCQTKQVAKDSKEFETKKA